MRATGRPRGRCRVLWGRRSLWVVAVAGIGLAVSLQAPVRAATLPGVPGIPSTSPAHPAGRWLVHVPGGADNTVQSVSVDPLTGRLAFAAIQEVPGPDGSGPTSNLIVGELSSSNGALQWEETIPDSSGSATIAPGGDLVVTGVFKLPSSFDGKPGSTNSCFVGRYQAVNHAIEWGYVLPTAICAPSAVDSLGDVYVAGEYGGPADIYGQQATGPGVYVARLQGMTGQPIWTRLVPNRGANIDHVTTYGPGQVFVSGTYDYLGQPITFGPGLTLPPPPQTGPTYVPYAWLASFESLTGTPVWARQLKVGGQDANSGGLVDSIAATGSAVTVTLECSGCDLGGGVVDYYQGLYGGLVAGYDSRTGGYLWSEAVSSMSNEASPLILSADPGGQVDFAGSGYYPQAVLDKPNDNLNNTTIATTPDEGGAEITGVISSSTGAITNVISTGGDDGSYYTARTADSSLSADTNGNLYTAGGFMIGTWQYGHYLPGNTASSTNADLYGFVAG